MKLIHALRWAGSAALISLFFFNCHQATDLSAALGPEGAERSPSSTSNAPSTIPFAAFSANTDDVEKPALSPSERPFGKPGEGKVRLSSSVLIKGSMSASGAPLLGNSSLGASSKTAQPPVEESYVAPGTRIYVIYDNDCRSQAYPVRYQFEEWTPQAPLPLSELESFAEGDPCVLQVGENRVYKLVDPIQDEASSLVSPVSGMAAVNDTRVTEARHITFSKALQSWDWFFSGVGIQDDVVVAIVDTGILYTHPDLQDNMYKDANGRYGWDSVGAGDNDPLDDNFHGTHVAGIVGARANNGIGVTGVIGQKVKLMAVKVLDAEGSGSSADIAEGILYAADHGAQVINMSLGGEYKEAANDRPVWDAMTYAASKGVVIVIAAGNSGAQITTSRFFVPSGYAKDIPGAIAVGSVDAVSGAQSSFSNFGSTYVWIAAPGSNGILSTYSGNGYTALQGTSMASPVVAGAAALIVGAFKARGIAYTPSQVISVLTDSARSVSTLTSSFRNGATLDIERAAKLFYSRYVMTGDAGTEAR